MSVGKPDVGQRHRRKPEKRTWVTFVTPVWGLRFAVRPEHGPHLLGFTSVACLRNSHGKHMFAHVGREYIPSKPMEQ